MQQAANTCRYWFVSSGQQRAGRGKSKHQLSVSVQQEVMHRRVAVCSRQQTRAGVSLTAVVSRREQKKQSAGGNKRQQLSVSIQQEVMHGRVAVCSSRQQTFVGISLSALVSGRQQKTADISQHLAFSKR